MPDWVYISYGVFVAAVLLEATGSWRFWAPVYSIGLRIRTVTDPSLGSPLAAVDEVMETEHAKFKVASPSRVLLRERYRFASRNTNVRCTIDWQSGSAVAVGRAAASPVIGIVAVVLVFVALTALGPDAPPGGLMVTAVLVLVALVVELVIITMQRRSLDVLLDEYRQWAEAQQPRA